MDRAALFQMIARHEGNGPLHRDRSLPYLDCCGRYWRDCVCDKKGTLTIGNGTNIDVGIDSTEREFLLSNRVDNAIDDLINSFEWFHQLDSVRQFAVVDLRYQLGADGFRGFKQTIMALAMGDYKQASRCLLASKLAKVDAPARTAETAQMILTGRMAE